MITILQDNDSAGHTGGQKVAEKIYKEFGSIAEIGQWDESLRNKFDVCADDEYLTETKKALQKAIPYKPEPKSRKGYNVISVHEALKLDIPKPKMIVEDILNERGSTILAATDNVGKSMMANQIALCIATGTDFLGYKVPRSCKVLLVQHEMENGEQLDRLRKQTAYYYEMYPELLKENLLMHLIEDGENLAITDQFEVLENTLIENPDIEVIVFDNIGQSTNVEMTNPDAIRAELKRLRTLIREYSEAFLLVAHHNKVDYSKEMDIKKEHIQGGKPITDWADNIVQLQTSSINPNLVLFKITKIRAVHDKEGHSTKLVNQGVWFNKDKDLLFTNRIAIPNWEAHFKATDKYERELEYLRELARLEQPFTTLLALNESQNITPPVSESTIKGYWLPKFCKYRWLIKERHGHYSVNPDMVEMFDNPISY